MVLLCSDEYQDKHTISNVFLVTLYVCMRKIMCMGHMLPQIWNKACAYAYIICTGVGVAKHCNTVFCIHPLYVAFGNATIQMIGMEGSGIES